MSARSRPSPWFAVAAALLAAGCTTVTRADVGPPPTEPPTVVPLPPPSVATTAPTDDVGSAFVSGNAGAVLPDPERTPGDVYPDVDVQLLCTPQYPGNVRNLSWSREVEAFAAYGIALDDDDFYQVDHLVPIGLGGTNALTNLWPVPIDAPIGVAQKDELEAALRELVCTGAIGLRTAQIAIATDWSAAYERFLGDPPAPIVTAATTPPTHPTGLTVGAVCDVEGAEALDARGRVLVCTETQQGVVVWMRRE